MRKICLTIAGLLLFATTAHIKAQEFKPDFIKQNANLQFETRIDANNEFDGDFFKTHFNCKNFNIVLKGKLSERISYKFRHRLNRSATGEDNFLKATDQAWIAFSATDKFTITAGKQTVALGGFEYDYAPIDMYIPSILYNNIPGYKIGVDLGFAVGKGDWHFQVTNGSLSPQEETDKHSFMNYSFAFNGQYVAGINYRHSVNFFEYQKGKFVNIIALGHQFNISKFTLEADLTNRAFTDDMKFFKDYTLTGNFKYDFGKVVGFVKLGYDENGNYVDMPNVIGAREAQLIYGVGFEYYPFTSRSLRFHAFYSSYQYDMLNTSKAASNLINFGVRWDVRLL